MRGIVIPNYRPLELLEIRSPRGAMEARLTLHHTDKILPQLKEALPFAETARAHRGLEAATNVGKVVLVP